MQHQGACLGPGGGTRPSFDGISGSSCITMLCCAMLCLLACFEPQPTVPVLSLLSLCYALCCATLLCVRACVEHMSCKRHVHIVMMTRDPIL